MIEAHPHFLLSDPLAPPLPAELFFAAWRENGDGLSTAAILIHNVSVRPAGALRTENDAPFLGAAASLADLVANSHVLVH
jgi:hypothetical protein